MTRHYKPMSPAARDARNERKPRAAGDMDFRSAVFLDLRGAGGPHLIGMPRRGKISWRLLDAQTQAVVDQGSIKELLHRVANRMTRMQSFYSL